ncbi:MAG: spermidine synthase, partial [Geodermatophilaceae bacterium]|nr:spermidine synthase [Geodermatophilaceae bacterium]
MPSRPGAGSAPDASSDDSERGGVTVRPDGAHPSDVDAEVGARLGGLSSIRLRLFIASFLMLFLELSLIRWSGSQVVHLSYFSNFVLLGSFLGIGLGFLRAGRPRRSPPYYSPIALLALIAFVSAYPVTVNREDTSIIFFTSLSTSGPPIWVTLPLIFLAVAAIMAGPGELVADCFHELPRLTAYRYDL